MVRFVKIFFIKLDLALKLAKSDCLFIIQNIEDFSDVMFFARLAEKKNKLSNADNLANFWQENEYILSHKIVKEIAARTDVIDFNIQEKLINLNLSYKDDTDKGLYKVKTYKCYVKESKFKEHQIVKELYDVSKVVSKFRYFMKSKDFQKSYFYNHLKLFMNIVENTTDLRFEASLLEEADEIYSSELSYLGFKVDWLETSKNKICVYDNKSVNTNDLSYNAQKNLVNIILSGLFNHKKFINNLYSNIWVNENDSISFFNVDYIYRIDDVELKYFLSASKAFQEKDVSKLVDLHKNLNLLEVDENYEKNLTKIIEDSFYDKPKSLSYLLANIYNYLGELNHGISLILLKLQYLLKVLEKLCPDIEIAKLISMQKIDEVKVNQNYSLKLDMLYHAKDVFNKKDVIAKDMMSKKSSFNRNEFKSCKYRKSSIIVWLPILVLIYLLLLFSN